MNRVKAICSNCGGAIRAQNQVAAAELRSAAKRQVKGLLCPTCFRESNEQQAQENTVTVFSLGRRGWGR